MTTASLEKTIDTLADAAASEDPPLRCSLAQLLLHSIDASEISSSEPALASKGRIEQLVLPYTQKSDDATFTFDPDQAINAYKAFDFDLPSHVSEDINRVLWLLEGDFDDGTMPNCRLLCSQSGLTTEFLLQSAPTSIAELGFGELVDRAWVQKQAKISGRDDELRKNLEILQNCIRKRQHFLLEGHIGVGKSVFVRALLCSAFEKWSSYGDTSLSSVQFVFLHVSDFAGSEERAKERISQLGDYLKKHVNAVPVFDGFEHLLSRALNIHEYFSAQFGSLLISNLRPFILVARSGTTSINEVVKHIPNRILSPLAAKPTSELVIQRIKAFLTNAPTGLSIQPNELEFVNTLMNLLPSRYPDRFLPEVAIHVAECTLARAIDRILHEKTPPLNAVDLGDLWQHVSEEQGINPETFGKNPSQFYRTVRSALREDVIGQDHAIETVCRELEYQARRPPQQTPRGRFLFVGPPGVGKTELGRRLAMRLGLGEDAFFIYNMGEYSSDTARTRFIGSDPGYVGFQSTSTIYDQVRSRPSCVILLDEVDRADETIQDILLSILEGQGRESDGTLVHFSQAIILMTTNQGQDQIVSAYNKSRTTGLSRADLAATFDDAELRGLLLQGVVNVEELDMLTYMNDTCDALLKEFRSPDLNDDRRIEIPPLYVRNKSILEQLKHTSNRSALDRAFLDRIDHIVPFFPLKEESEIRRIIDQKLYRFGWGNCPDRYLELILNDAMAEEESVRPIERLIKRYFNAYMQLQDELQYVIDETGKAGIPNALLHDRERLVEEALATDAPLQALKHMLEKYGELEEG